MMRFHVKRSYTPRGTPGEMLDESGARVCLTIERASVEFSSDHPCINEGTFRAKRVNSPKHGPNTWELQDVPGRTNIQVHIANKPHELLGCIAVGVHHFIDDTGEPGVDQSRIAYERFMQLTHAETEIEFTFSKAEPIA